jgi:hypothetical protein
VAPVVRVGSRWLGIVAFALAIGLVAFDATAQETEEERRQEILDVLGPASLPSLSHEGVGFNFEYTIASAAPTDSATGEELDGSRALAYVARWLFELPIVDRSWYLGVEGEVGAASVPSGQTASSSGGSSLLFGNPEIWMRALWSSTVGLAGGGGLSVVVPVPRTFSDLEGEVVRAIRTVRPAGFPHYQDLTVTARPYVDIRHVAGPVVLQARQGLDFSLVARDLNENENRYDMTAWLNVFVGVEIIEQLVLGMEATEVYQLTADTTSPTCVAPCDARRAQLTLSPQLRARIGRLSPAVSFLFPVSTPLRSEIANYYAARVHLDVLF